ncbi:MAG: hypothetical protein KDE55_11945 [Novosphingobium sp.]|nr:hypothetical protein [Novosphingobium sp.]
MEFAATVALRVIDAAIALFWLWILVKSLLARRIGGPRGFKASRLERPGQYWFAIGVFVLMVIHFAGLAIMGQHLDF